MTDVGWLVLMCCGIVLLVTAIVCWPERWLRTRDGARRSQVDVRAGILMGEALLRMERFAEARCEYEKAGVDMPKEGFIAWGEKALAGDELDAARQLFLEAANVEQRNPPAY
jgi:hypothetical protein